MILLCSIAQYMQFLLSHLHLQLNLCLAGLVQYRSDVMSHSLAILLLDSQNSSLFSRQLSVHVCRKSARVKPSVELQITSLEYRLAQGLN